MKSNFKTIFREVIRTPMFSVINISGLAIGISCMILTLLWAGYELGYDGFNKNEDGIYKISQGKNFSTVPPLFNSIHNEFPEIEKIIRTSNDAEAYINSVDKDNKIKVKNVLYTSPCFSDIFTVKTLSGNTNSALNDPSGIILTQASAMKIFGKTDVEGNAVRYRANFPPRDLTLTVKSVIEDFPSNSTLKFDAIIPFEVLNNLKPNGINPDENWRDGYCNLYILLKKGTDFNLFANKLEEYGGKLEQKVYDLDPKSPEAKERKLGLVHLTDLHFFQNNRKQLVGYISIIGFLILLIAVINYANLSIAKLFTARQSLYIRKINGANRSRLIFNIVAESVLYSILAFFVALLFIWVFNPLLTKFLNIDLTNNFFDNPGILVAFLFAALLIGVVAGLYPALKLTSEIPATLAQAGILKKERNFVRQSLVVFQFAISIALIISASVISKQLIFFNRKDLGFNNQQIVYAKLNGNLYGKSYQTFKEKLQKSPNVQSVSGSQNELGQICVTLDREINGAKRYFQELPADPDFIKTMGLKLIQGRNFSWDMPTDPYQTLIISETAVKAFGLDSTNVIGTEIFMYDRVAKVVGVVKDFYFQSFHHQLDPFMLFYHPGSIGTVNIKISGNNIPGTIKYINDVWNEFSPEIPFEYHFLDKTYEELYKQDRQFSKIILAFLLVSILIACMGLLGLVSFTTVRRTKEIGVRKVNGATISEVIVMLNRDFVKWVVIAFVVATPIAYYAMNKWLENFAYKTTLSWWIFALAGLLALGIALLTVSWQSWKAATRNPVEALRYE